MRDGRVEKGIGCQVAWSRLELVFGRVRRFAAMTSVNAPLDLGLAIILLLTGISKWVGTDGESLMNM